MGIVTEFQKTTWGNQLKNSYKRSLDLRSEGTIRTLKIKQEKLVLTNQKIRFSAIRSIMRILGYVLILLFISGLLLPPFVMNYVKTQIKEGEWVNVDQEKPVIGPLEVEEEEDFNDEVIKEDL